MSNDPLLAVLIHDRVESFQQLKDALGHLSAELYYLAHCTSAGPLIGQYQPLVVFVDLPTWRKSHAEIVGMAMAADHSFNVIVVGYTPDIELYVSAIELGAFNYVAPPFSHDTLTVAVHCAAMDARERRESLAQVFMNAAGKKVESGPATLERGAGNDA